MWFGNIKFYWGKFQSSKILLKYGYYNLEVSCNLNCLNHCKFIAIRNHVYFIFTSESQIMNFFLISCISEGMYLIITLQIIQIEYLSKECYAIYLFKSICLSCLYCLFWSGSLKNNNKQSGLPPDSNRLFLKEKIYNIYIND